jgi:hypothetical protein
MLNIPNQKTGKCMALTVTLMMTLSLATSPMLTAAQSSQQDKITACNNLADKKGLKGDDRKNFMQDCINKTADVQKPSDMSTKDKMNSCKDLADKRNLKGSDRRSFIKDCMDRLNSK